MNPSGKSLFRSFPGVFWISNVMELFERGAYYGMNSVLAVYLTNSVLEGGLGFSEQSVGFLQGLVYAMTYIVPILGGALADRYGYRKMLLVAFALLSAGYYVTGHMSSYALVFTSLLMMATGAGLFKPVISGTIARVTTEGNSGFGFGVYYWMINLGAFLAPLAVSVLKGFDWSYVFTASSLYCALMIIPALFLYRDPPKPENLKSLKDVLSGAAMVLGDARFMLMIVLYSGFWIVYFQNFGSVLWYLRDFVDRTPVNGFLASLGIPVQFDAEHITVINAGTIILLQVFVSRIVKNMNPLKTMIAGMIIGGAAFCILTLSQSVWLLIAVMGLFSLGEMTAHPKYYSYVGLVAPADKKAVYMGYAFLYGVIGSLLGSNIGGTLYETILKPVIGQPGSPSKLTVFWLVFAGLDFLAVAGLIAYNRWFIHDTPNSHFLARRVMVLIYGFLAVTGIVFAWHSVWVSEPVAYKTLIQALILLFLGGGGITISLRHKPDFSKTD